MSSSQTIGGMFKAGLIALVLFVCLGSEFLHRGALPWRFLNQIQAEVLVTLKAADVQWMVAGCIAVYFVGFVWLLRSFNHGLCVLGSLGSGVVLFVIGALAYARSYDLAAKSTDALLLFFGITLFLGVRFWQAVELNRSQRFDLAGAVVVLVLGLLCLGAVWHPEAFQSFQYRGTARWSGLWDNPNTFGVLMAVGVVLATGWAVSGVKCQVSGDEKAEIRKWKAGIGRWVGIALLVGAAGVCGVGLVKSYSRGAWLGVACGLGFIGYQVVSCQVSGAARTESRKLKAEIPFSSCVSWFTRNWLSVAAILVSVLLIGFWNLRHAEGRFARRMASLANAQDFSARNRLAAWVGSLQMLADKPWLGFGWNQPERDYEEWYCPAKIPEAMAIQLNDYFTLGTTLGIPALVCFLAFVGLILTRSAECGMRNEETETGTSPDPRQNPHPACGHPLPSDGRGASGEGEVSPVTLAARERSAGGRHIPLAAVCRAAAVVLLVGFWFDGGLFKLPTSSVFWILLALGSVEGGAGRESRIENRGGPQAR